MKIKFNLPKALDTFSKVNRKQYPRIDYALWTELSKIKGNVTYNSTSAVLETGYSAYSLNQTAFGGFEQFLIDNYCNINKGDNDTMANSMPSINFDFGPISSDKAQYSPYGIAIKNKDSWMVYDSKTGKTIDVTGLTFDFGNFICRMPTAIKDIKVGDVIIHKDNPVFVTEIKDNKVVGIDICNSEEKTIIPISNMFGFDFVTKIVSLINLDITPPSADQPFGNFMQMMLMSQLFGGKSDGFFSGIDMGKMMMLSMLTGQSNPLNMFSTMLQSLSMDHGA